LIAQSQATGTSSAGISRNRHQPCKFETDKNKLLPTCIGTDLLCFVYIFSKGIRCAESVDPERVDINKHSRVFGI
jgi:hypothetical protein